MARLSDMELAKAFVSKSALNFADVISSLEARVDLKLDRQRDMISGLKRVASAIGWSVADCPADPVWLRPKLAKVMPAAIGVSKKTWTNSVSNAKSAMAELDVIERDRGSPLELSKEWKSVWDTMLASGKMNIRTPVSRFVRFCSNIGVKPSMVCDETVRSFRRALELNELRKDPDSTVWQAIHAWNLARLHVQGWPQTELTKPIRNSHYALAIDAFPSAFREDLDRVIATLESSNFKLGAKRRQALSLDTVEHRKRQWIRFASAQVHSGIPLEECQSLLALLELTRVEAAFEWLSQNRYGGKTSAGLHEMALGICTLGRELGIDEDHLEQLREYARHLSSDSSNRSLRKKGLTEKNRERLRQFRDPAKLDALLRLPGELMADAGRMNHPVTAARLAEMAIAISIETVAPIRLKNLASLDLRRHFDRSIPGKLYMVIPEYEVKNGAPLEFELPDRVRKLIEEFDSKYRSDLSDRPNPWLFARLDGTDHVHRAVLARRIKEIFAERPGVEMNVHLFRHLAAVLILESDPGAYDLVRRILGHSELSATLDAYSGMESLSATRFLSELVETAHEDPPVRSLTPRRSR